MCRGLIALRTLALVAATFLCAIPARAQETEAALQSWAQTQSAQCLDAARASETRWDIPPGLLQAIFKSESGRPIPPRGGLGPWPWTIDADGKGAFYDTRAAAVAGARDAMAAGARYVDVGCGQVNLQHHPGAFRDLDQAFDPVANADYAGRFLRSLRDGPGGGNWYQALGFYHSQTPERAAWYRERIAAVAEGRAPPPALPGGPMPLYQRAVQRGALRFTLAGGGVLVLRVRQPSAGPHRRLTACQAARVLGDFLSPAAARGCRR